MILIESEMFVVAKHRSVRSTIVVPATRHPVFLNREISAVTTDASYECSVKLLCRFHAVVKNSCLLQLRFMADRRGQQAHEFIPEYFGSQDDSGRASWLRRRPEDSAAAHRNSSSRILIQRQSHNAIQLNPLPSRCPLLRRSQRTSRRLIVDEVDAARSTSLTLSSSQPSEVGIFNHHLFRPRDAPLHTTAQ
jgi:hypothetical protein